jgi:hypothetical protein
VYTKAPMNIASGKLNNAHSMKYDGATPSASK